MNKQYKIASYALVCVVLGVVLYACQKDKLNTNQTSNTGINSPLRTGGQWQSHGADCFDGISVICDNILKFDDIDHYYEVYDCLEAEYETWCDEYSLLYSTQNDDQYNDQIDQNGWDEEIPLDDFEAEVSGYFSLRRHINQLEDAWLDNTVLDPETDPDNLYIDDEFDRTLINSEGNVAIGTSIWHFEGLDVVYEITNSDCDLLQDVMNNPENFQTGLDTNVIYHRNHDGNTVPDGCEIKCLNESEYDECASWKKFKWKLSYNAGTPPFSKSRAEAKIRSYKQKSNNKWKKWRTRLKVNVEGNWYNDACSVYNNLYKQNGWDRRKKLRVRNSLNNTWFWKYQDFGGDFFQTSSSCTYHHDGTPP